MTPTTSIRRSLLLHQILVILLLSGSLLVTTFLAGRTAVSSLSSSIIGRGVTQAETELGGFFTPIADHLRMVRLWGSEGVFDPGEIEALNKLFRPILEAYPQIASASLADNDGGEYRLLRTQHGEWLNRLTTVASGEQRARWLQWSGDRLVPTAEWLRNVADPRETSWFGDTLTEPWVEAGELHHVHWTEPYRFGASGRLGLTAAITLVAQGGRLYVAAFDVPLDGLRKFVEAIEPSPNASVTLMAAGRIIAIKRDERLWPGDPDQAILRTPTELQSPLVEDALSAFREEDPGNPGEPISFRSLGERYWGQLSQFELAPDRSLVLAVLAPDRDVQPGGPDLRPWIVVISLVVLAAAALRSAFFARRISRPVRELVRQTERFRDGDLLPGGPRVETSLTELEMLAGAHEDMRHSLRSLVKLEDDLEIARQIQRATLPDELPEVPGFDVGAWSEPAERTGGDAYDAVALDGSSSGPHSGALLLLADASGHGIGPALSVTEVRAMLRIAVRTGSTLEEITAHLNEQLCDDLPPNRFITAWLAELRTEGSEVRYWSAGQGPLLYYEAETGKVRTLDANAPPMGLVDLRDPPRPVRIEMRPGDAYAVLTDGFFEATNAWDEELGVERVAQLLKDRPAATANELIVALRELTHDFTGGAPAEDDRTVVIVKRVSEE